MSMIPREYRDNWPDYDDNGDIPAKLRLKGWGDYVIDSDGEIGAVGPFIGGGGTSSKTRGTITREAWMRQKYGEDWKTNGRVVIGCGAIEPQYRIVSRSEWGSWEGSRIQTPEERRVAISMGLVPETTWIVRKKPTDTANAA